MNNNELLEQAKAAKSPEELLKIAKENGFEDFTEESAKAYFEALHKSGEISDDELEQAAGGCHTINGKTIVTCDHNCHCASWANAYDYYGCKRDDYVSLRKLWYYNTTNPSIQQCPPNKCGTCIHLGFTSAGIGYCEIK